MSIKSLKLLRAEMKDKFGFKYLLTHRLNQDCLENTYSQMRYRNGANDHPTPTDCLNNLKSIILGKNPGVCGKHSNTIDRDTDEYVSATFNKVLSSADYFNDIDFEQSIVTMKSMKNVLF